jgi:glycosyltransferase involved in cell wall biosynthesis
MKKPMNLKMKAEEIIFVLVPSFNEDKNISEVINEIKNLDMNIYLLVLDDGSIDSTYEAVKKSGVNVLRHDANLGQWAALKTLFQVALMEGAEIIVTMDGDGQHDPKNIFPLIQPLKLNQADVVIGSRFLESNVNMKSYRKLGIKFFNFLLRIITQKKFTDCTSGFRAFKSDVIKTVLPNLKENQYGALEFLIEICKQESKITEIPITNITSKKTTKGKIKFGFHLLRSILYPKIFS